MRSLFLSASVPDPKRHPKFHSTADRSAIRDAVCALVSVALPTMRLVWGGHPAITPLVRVVAEGLDATGGDFVRVYQSNFFRRELPNDNAAFERVVRTRQVRDDRDASLALMRRKMLSSEKFAAGIFIGGMEGVEEEYRMFRQMHAEVPAFPIASTGAAALLIYQRADRTLPAELEKDLAYPSLFRRLLSLPAA